MSTFFDIRFFIVLVLLFASLGYNYYKKEECEEKKEEATYYHMQNNILYLKYKELEMKCDTNNHQ